MCNRVVHSSVIVIIFILFVFSPVFGEEKKESKESGEEQYIAEHERARLSEARTCIGKNSGTSWQDCRYNCADTCNEILEPYSRGVCNGVLIQLCCGIYPSECK